eukprot:36223-Chlamydomonas_euryale.AAC.3
MHRCWAGCHASHGSRASMAVSLHGRMIEQLHDCQGAYGAEHACMHGCMLPGVLQARDSACACVCVQHVVGLRTHQSLAGPPCKRPRTAP